MIAEQLQHIEKIAHAQQLDTVLSQAGALHKLLAENGHVELVILGQFKAGKSSLINSFLDEAVLPVGVLPVTAVITRLAYGKEKRASVEKRNGEVLQVPLNELKSFITEKENPANSKQVHLVDIRLPELHDLQNLRIIDTPGLGSVYQHNTAVTKDWYKNIGAAIVVISAIQPLSENDLALIRSAMEQSPEVDLILSKSDLVDSAHINELIQFINTSTQKELGRKFRIFPYSIFNNNKKFLREIENKIFRKLAKEAPEANHRIAKHKLKYLCQKTKTYLSISLNLQNKAAGERSGLHDKIIDEQLKLRYIKQELTYISEHYKTATRKKLEAELISKHKDGLIGKLKNELSKSFDGWKGNLGKLSRNYENWIRNNMADAMTAVENDEKDFMQQHVNEAHKHFNNYLSGFRERLNQNLEKILGLRMPNDDFKVEVSLMEKANISVSWAFESHIDLLWFLIPMAVFRKTFKGYFLRQIPGEVEKNLRRLVSLLNNNINAVIDKLHLKSLNYLISELDTVSRVLDTPQSESRDIQQEIQLLNKIMEEVGRKKF